MKTSRSFLKRIFRRLKVEAQDAVKAAIVSIWNHEMTDQNLMKNLSIPGVDEPRVGDMTRYFRERKRVCFFIDIEWKEEILSDLNDYFPEAPNSILTAADRICEHIFNVLGSGDVSLGESLPWHCDFTTGYCWNSRKYFKRLKIPYGRAEIKIPWELSRFHHVVPLGKAYWLTGDEKYAREFKAEIEDWIRQNPKKCGVNWASTMDVAIRIVNWIWGYHFFKNSEELSERFFIHFLKSLLEHGRHIAANIEIYENGLTTNHTISDYVGLVYVGLSFPELKEAKDWLDRGVAGLRREMEVQICPDGVNYESSIAYHRLVAELLTSATLFLRLNGSRLPDIFLRRLEKMFEYILFYTQPDGKAPQVGDADDGRLHILGEYDHWDRTDHRYLLSIGAVLFGRGSFKRAAGGNWEEAFWLLGKEGWKKFTEMPEDSSCPSSRAFVDGGVYIMRNKDCHMLVHANHVGTKGVGNHTHNDVLSFELYARDKAFIIDPGTYTYTADPHWRNTFRSTAYHNTVVVDGEEQNRTDERLVFSLENDATPRVTKWKSNDIFDLFDAEHDGYLRLAEPVTHRRQLFFDKSRDIFIIRDILTGHGTHTFELYFHLAPLALRPGSKDSYASIEESIDLFRTVVNREERVEHQSSLCVQTLLKGPILRIVPLSCKGLSLETNGEGWFSYRYGLKQKAPVVKYVKRSPCPAEFLTAVEIV